MYKPVITWDTPWLKVSAGDSWLTLRHGGQYVALRGAAALGSLAGALRKLLAAYGAGLDLSETLPDGNTTLSVHEKLFFIQLSLLNSTKNPWRAGLERELVVDLLAWTAHVTGGVEQPEGDLADLAVTAHNRLVALNIQKRWAFHLDSDDLAATIRLVSAAAGADSAGPPVEYGSGQRLAIEGRSPARCCMICTNGISECRLWVTRAGLGRLAEDLARAAAQLRARTGCLTGNGPHAA